jgi:hypothetical protein
MLREQVAPALRELGFTGSGPAYSLPDDAHWALVGFQKSAWSDSDSVAFTVNVTVASRDVWENERRTRLYLPAKPAPNTHYGDYVWQTRIGFLLPSGRDHWWEVEAGTTTETLAAEVVGAIRDYALPAMRRQL